MFRHKHYNENMATSALVGLTSQEAARRLKKNGPNLIAKPHRLTGVEAFAKRLFNPLVLILLASAGAAYYLGDRVSSIIIITIVVLSSLLDYLNTHRSAEAVKALQTRVRVTTSVMRDGHASEVPLAELVVGDVVLLKAGSIVPADGRVLSGEHMYANESALTGESFPQSKEPGAVVFMGSSLVSGHGAIEITATGEASKYSHIAKTLAGREAPTEFDREIKDFSVLIVKITLSLVAFIFAVNVLYRHHGLEALLFSLALAVGLTPELLPIIMTLNLARGSLDMAKRGVIVKKLSAIQNFGSMDVLCTDKTGTLTEDRITLVKHLDPTGKPSDVVLELAYVSSVTATSFDNPLDKAIRSFRHLDVRSWRKVDEIPFDFVRRRDSIVATKNGKQIMITKGAPEEVLKICKGVKTTAKIKKIYDQLSQDGYRVLGLATREVPLQKDYTPVSETGMKFAGFMAFLDPPKASVSATLKRLESYGIEVKIVTGDNLLVTQKIAREIALPVKGILEGSEIEVMKDAKLAEVAERTTIFARVSPEQKMRIIKLLKGRHVVGYMGDGINDAPPLWTADVGISVNNAVDVAKDTAQLILMHKSLADLTEGVVEGRKTFANTLKYLKMSLSSNFGNMFSMAGASLLLPFLPMLAPQILFNNLLYDSSQFAIPLDQVDPDDITHPHTLSLSSIKKFMWVFGPLSSLFDFATFGVLLLIFHLSAHQFQAGWFIESLATQTLVVYVIRTKKIPFIESRPASVLIFSTLAALIVGSVVALSRFGAVFEFSRLPALALVAVGLIVTVYLFSVQAVKQAFFKRVAL